MNQDIIGQYFLKYLISRKMQKNLVIFLISFLSFVACSQFPKILWTYWQEGVKNNQLADMFDEHHKLKINGWEGWQVRMIDRDSVKDYLKFIPWYTNDVDTIPYPMIQHKSDYIRSLLLSYYGGVWMDHSSIFVQNFTWLKFQNLRTNPDVINVYGDQPDVFFFTFPDYGSKKTQFYPNLNQTFEVSPGYQMWFMAAKPSTPFMRLFLDQLRKGMYQRMHFWSTNNYMDNIVKAQNIEVGSIMGNAYLASLNLIQTIIQRKQLQLDRIQVAKGNSTRQLAVWYYKLWHIKAQKGPFAILLKFRLQQTDFLAKYSLAQLHQIYNITIRYFVKLIGTERNTLAHYFYGVQRGTNFEQSINIFSLQLDQSKIQKYFCPQYYSIHNSSFLYTHLILGNSHSFDAQIVNQIFDPTVKQCLPLRNFIYQLKNRRITFPFQYQVQSQNERLKESYRKYLRMFQILKRYDPLLNPSNIQLNNLQSQNLQIWQSRIVQVDNFLKDNVKNDFQVQKNDNITLHVVYISIIVYLTITCIIMLVKILKNKQILNARASAQSLQSLESPSTSDNVANKIQQYKRARSSQNQQEFQNKKSEQNNSEDNI